MNLDRIIVLDTETTGMNQDGGFPHLNHRVIEIGAVEIINRHLTGKTFHAYLNVDCEIQLEATAVHGITKEFLADKPTYNEIHEEFYNFILGATLVAHNAAFDVGFLNQEFNLIDPKLGKLSDFCEIIDSLAIAKRLFPRKRNNLDALCERYQIDNSARTLHGALLDAEILADVYLLMTGGQTTLDLNQVVSSQPKQEIQKAKHTAALKVIYASKDELTEHEKRMQLIKNPLW